MSIANQLAEIRAQEFKPFGRYYMPKTYPDDVFIMLKDYERDRATLLAIIDADRAVLRDIRTGTLYHSEAVELARKRLTE